MKLIKKTNAKNLNKSVEKIKQDLQEKNYADKLAVQNDTNFYLTIVFKTYKEKVEFMKSKKIRLDVEFIINEQI